MRNNLRDIQSFGSFDRNSLCEGSMRGNCREPDLYHVVVAGSDDNHRIGCVLGISGVREFLGTDQDLSAEQSDAGEFRNNYHSVYATICRQCNTSHYSGHFISGGYRHVDDADH